MTGPLTAGEPLNFLEETKSVRVGAWKVASTPADLQDRRVEITGPSEPKMMINALNCGARCFMADLEDSLSPTWANCILGRESERRKSEWENLFGKPERRMRRICELAENGQGCSEEGQQVPANNLNAAERLLVRWSRRVPITYLGIYDTVGAIGWDALAIPVSPVVSRCTTTCVRLPLSRNAATL